MATLAFLGAGAMAQALARGLITAQKYRGEEIVFFAPTLARVEKLAFELGARAAASPREAVEGADCVVLAVKPALIERALEPLHAVLTPNQTLISVAAGISTGRIEGCFDAPIPVVRSMPNTPALVGAAATAICSGTHAKPSDLERAREIFSALGLAVEVEERLMDAVTGLSGSGPAYVFLFIEALADGGVRAGLRRDMALQLAAQTVLGAAQMVLQSGEHPGVLKDRVASPGGTTIAGVHALEEGAFRGTVMNAVAASANRAKELI